MTRLMQPPRKREDSCMLKNWVFLRKPGVLCWIWVIWPVSSWDFDKPWNQEPYEPIRISWIVSQGFCCLNWVMKGWAATVGCNFITIWWKDYGPVEVQKNHDMGRDCLFLFGSDWSWWIGCTFNLFQAPNSPTSLSRLVCSVMASL